MSVYRTCASGISYYIVVLVYLLVNLWLIGNRNINNIVWLIIILAISQSIVQDLGSFVAKFRKFLVNAKKLVPQISVVEAETNAVTHLFFGWSLVTQGYKNCKLGGHLNCKNR